MIEESKIQQRLVFPPTIPNQYVSHEHFLDHAGTIFEASRIDSIPLSVSLDRTRLAPLNHLYDFSPIQLIPKSVHIPVWMLEKKHLAHVHIPALAIPLCLPDEQYTS